MNSREMKALFESRTVLSFFGLCVEVLLSGSPTNTIAWYLGCLRAVANFTAKIFLKSSMLVVLDHGTTRMFFILALIDPIRLCLPRVSRS